MRVQVQLEKLLLALRLAAIVAWGAGCAGVDAGDDPDNPPGTDTPPVVSTASVYDVGSRLIGEYDEKGSAIQELIYLEDRLVAVVRSGQVFAVQTDQLGAPRAVLSGGALVWKWDPEPFGSTPPQEDPDGDGTSFTFHERFPGQRLDPATGMYQNHHRNYMPELGRYAEADPIGLQGGANLYAYADGNPGMFNDPLGLSPEIPAPTVVRNASRLATALSKEAIVVANVDHGAKCESDECRRAGNTNFGVYSTRWWSSKRDFFWPTNMPGTVSAKIFINIVCWGGAGAMGQKFLEAGGSAYIGAAGEPVYDSGNRNTAAVTRLLQQPNITGNQVADELNMIVCRQTNPKVTLEECRRTQQQRSFYIYGQPPNWGCQGNCDIPLSDLFGR